MPSSFQSQILFTICIIHFQLFSLEIIKSYISARKSESAAEQLSLSFPLESVYRYALSDELTDQILV